MELSLYPVPLKGQYYTSDLLSHFPFIWLLLLLLITSYNYLLDILCFYQYQTLTSAKIDLRGSVVVECISKPPTLVANMSHCPSESPRV